MGNINACGSKPSSVEDAAPSLEELTCNEKLPVLARDVGGAHDLHRSFFPADHKKAVWLVLKALFICVVLYSVKHICWHAFNLTTMIPHFVERYPEPVLRPLPRCPQLTYIESAWFEYEDISQFEFYELLNTHGFPPRRIGGKVSLVEGPQDQIAQVRALVLFGSSDQHMVRSIAMSKMASSLIIDATYTKDGMLSFPNLCLTLDVYLLLKPGIKLDNFKVNVTNLSVELRRGLTTHVRDATSISAISGDVGCAEASTFESRETVIDVQSGSVTGVWALFDLLSINTRSGSISVGVQPKEAAQSKPVAAVFEAGAQSGSIGIAFPTAGIIPDRDYRVNVFSQSGALSGSYLHGTSTSLISRSGSLTANILPLNGNVKDTTLVTESYSGSTSINVMLAYMDSDKPMNHLQSRHTAQAGTLTLHYPRSWQGTIDGSVMSGSLDVRGPDVKIVKDEKTGPMHHIVARKGEGDGHMQFGTTSGSAVVTFD